MLARRGRSAALVQAHAERLARSASVCARVCLDSHKRVATARAQAVAWAIFAIGVGVALAGTVTVFI